jgi:hypothetical protein
MHAPAAVAEEISCRSRAVVWAKSLPGGVRRGGPLKGESFFPTVPDAQSIPAMASLDFHRRFQSYEPC